MLSQQLGTPAGTPQFLSLIVQARAARSDEDFRKYTALAPQDILHEELLFISLAELPFVLATRLLFLGTKSTEIDNDL